MAERVAIVTGGTRGLGAAIVARLLGQGYDVVTCGRREPEALPEASGRRARFVPCDVRDAAQARAFVEDVVARHGRLDALVNNAGGSPAAAAATASPRFSEAIVALNLMAPLHLSQAAYPALRAAGGAIVNIASLSGTRPSPGTAVYGAAKAGLLSLTRSLAQEWAPAVRVNAVVVGLVETETTAATYGNDAAQRRIAASVPLKRMGGGGDVAEAVAFLLSPAAGWISGAQLAVDGGGERPPFLDIVADEGGPAEGPAAGLAGAHRVG